jgi:hypothetical protein
VSDLEERIGERLAAQRARLDAACRRAGRPSEDVRLLAVSKRQPLEAIRAAYAAGQRDFGENYVQELVEKAEALRDLPGLRWHMIGHLQTNKARLLARVVSSVQTVSSVRLAEELGRRVGQALRTLVDAPAALRAHPPGSGGELPPSALPLSVLVEVNLGGEASKSGCPPDALEGVLDAVEAQPHLWLRGLMVIPPYTEDPEGARPYFVELARLRDRSGGAERLPELSMGMSADAEVAIECGATWVRLGTALFGERGAR